MNSKVIAVDFDGTLCYSNWPAAGPPNSELINWLLKKQADGAQLILWTCREGDALQTAISWCHAYGLYFNAVNENVPDQLEKYGTNPRKVGADIYIDDLAFNPKSFIFV